MGSFVPSLGWVNVEINHAIASNPTVSSVGLCRCDDDIHRAGPAFSLVGVLVARTGREASPGRLGVANVRRDVISFVELQHAASAPLLVVPTFCADSVAFCAESFLYLLCRIPRRYQMS